ncbi:hypothetical protein [Streptomyces sp. NPDC004284]
MLAGVLEFQAPGEGQVGEVVEAYGEGAAVKAPARRHGVAPKTAR